MVRFLVLGLMLVGGIGQSEAVSASEDDGIRQGREMIRAGRADLVRDELQLTAEEATAFWPLYEAFRDDCDEVMDRYTVLVTGYMRRYEAGDLTNEYADRLIDEYFVIQRDRLGVQQAYLDKFRAILPALKVARFYQLENKTNAEIDAQLALVVPLVDPS